MATKASQVTGNKELQFWSQSKADEKGLTIFQEESEPEERQGFTVSGNIEYFETKTRFIVSGNTFAIETLSSETIIESDSVEHKNDVAGTVIGVSDESVICEIYFEKHTEEVNLPRSFFPEDVQYGMGINLMMDETSGIRKPVIKTRELSPEAAESGKEDMEKLIREL